MALSLPARSDDLRQSATALAPEHGLLIPAMKADAFSGGRAILISGSGAESVRIGSIPRKTVPTGQWIPTHQVATGDCADYLVDTLNFPGGRK